MVGTLASLLPEKPTGNLGSKNDAMVIDLPQALHAEGATVCVVTRDPRYADRARRTIHLYDARLMNGPEAGT